MSSERPGARGDDPSPDAPTGARRVMLALLVLATAALTLAALFAWGWWRAARRPIDLARIPEGEREALVRRALAESPGVYQAAWFEPGIGYTLRPRARLAAFGDRFTSNELGYRTHPAAKPASAVRVLFVGDSWTFGLGVVERDTVPARFEALARAHQPPGRRVQAWNLALPGYNTLNELAALDYFHGRLRPDAVVLCPTSNDIDTAAVVLPNGSLGRSLAPTDPLGDVHSLRFGLRLVDSYKFRSRWSLSFRKIRDAELRLRQQGVPLLLFFTGTWDEDHVHALVSGSQLQSPYLIVPASITVGPWRNPAPYRHATAGANRLYAGMLYRALAPMLALPPAADLDPRSAVPVHTPTRRAGLSARVDHLLQRATAARIPERYRRGTSDDAQCLGPMDCTTGVMGRATTVLVRRRAGSSRLEVTLERLPGLAHLYPLEVTIAIATAERSPAVHATLRADGPAAQTVSIPIPASIRAGSAMDVTIEASRAAPLEGLTPRSLAVAAIEQP